MYPCINGWTKERMRQAIRAGNNGTRAMQPGIGRCVYLTHDGNKCAVGCFIPDGHPAQRSNDVAYGLIHGFPDLAASMPLAVDGLSYMQSQHDYCPPDADVRDVLCAWIEANVSDGEVAP
jgi:hypothetical protein